MRPRLLDLYSGASGAAMGYHRAGSKVGVCCLDHPSTTLPDPIVMAALAHLESGHDVRAWWCLDLLIRQMRARARVA